MASAGKRGRKAASARRSAPSPEPAAPSTPPAAEEERDGHSEFELADDQVEQALQTGDHAGLLEDYFGPAEYRQLRQLAREAAARRSVRGGPRVLILPGIMGSKLGRPRRVSLFDDVLWFDPVDIAAGKLSTLALRGAGGDGLQAVGVMLTTYLKLKLRLQAAGFEARFHPFDWRRSIADLGRELARVLDAEGGGRVSIVAHSMGGLVARAALAAGGECDRLVMLGTPNFGSFAPVQALRATYPVVRKVAALGRHEPEELARDVFSTFPGLTQMLPSPERFADVDLYDLERWPDDGLRPRAEILADVRAVQEGLAGTNERFDLIAGVDQETVVGLKLDSDRKAFTYELSGAGDGTVPLDLARLPGVSTYYVAEGHGSLPNHRLVAQAVVDLLTRGSTKALPSTYAAEARRGAVRLVPESRLREEPYTGRRGALLSQRELRTMLEEVAAPGAHDAPAAPIPVGALAGAEPAAAGYQHEFQRIVVGRRRQHRVDLRFALGSITEVDARAIVLGIFRDVTPTGAAGAVDRELEGAIVELSRRRMYSGNVGEVFILPTGRHRLRADLVALVGLGPFDRFNEEVLQVAAENVIRTFVNTRVEEFATVLLGAGSGENPAMALRGLLGGFVRGLCDADRDHRFRRIIVCENDAPRYTQLKEELYRLSSTPLCQDVEFTFDEVTLPAPLEPAGATRAAGPSREDPVYLIVRQEQESEDGSRFGVRSSVLTAGGKPTVVTGMCTVERDAFDELRGVVADPYTPIDEMEKGGAELAELLIAPEVRAVLPRQHERHLVVVHDAPLSRVPWETLAFPAGNGGRTPWLPAAEAGLSHRYAADNLSVAKWLEERLRDDVLHVLLVVNPTGDLPGAEGEGARIEELFGRMPGCRITRLEHKEATRPALLKAFASGQFDVVHYAGHAFFQEASPSSSGLQCYDGETLSGADLAGLGNLPALVFFNACESGRLRGGAVGKGAAATAGAAAGKRTGKTTGKTGGKTAGKGGKGTKQGGGTASGGGEKPPTVAVAEAVGAAEAFLRGGVANFLGTYWLVGDEPAELFADTFYTRIMRGETLGDAIQAGRKRVRAQRSRDWADYVFYGNPDFVLKEAVARRAAAAASG